MDSGKTDNERELTSTMGNVLSMSIKDEKDDTNGSDATPTSSTDANTTTTSSQIVSDDPISSTSKTVETETQSSVDVSQTGMEVPDKDSIDTETDLLEMSISNVPCEKITEDVEDLVHDLESLLGESTDSFNIPIKRREERKSLEKETTKISHKPDEGGDVLLVNESKPIHVEKKPEEELQPKISQEKTLDVSENNVNETEDLDSTQGIPKLTEGLEKTCNEASSSQQETVLETEAVIEEVIIVESDDTADIVETEKIEESPSEVVEIVEETIEYEEVIGSPAHICEPSSPLKVDEPKPLNIEEKCEEELQPKICQEGTSDGIEDKVSETEGLDAMETSDVIENKVNETVDLDTTAEILKLTEDLEKTSEEASSSQQETLLEPEAVVTEEVVNVESDDTVDKVETEEIEEESPSEVVEVIEENVAEYEEIVSSADDNCEISSPLQVNESNVEEKPEEELQPEISQDTENGVNEIENFDSTVEIHKLTGDLEKAEDEASSSQQENPLESEAVVTEEVVIVESDDITDKVEIEHIEESLSEMVETVEEMVEESIAECEETISSADVICVVSSPLEVNESKPLHVEEKCEEELQPDVSQEGTLDVTEDKVNETEDVDAIEEIPGILEKAKDASSVQEEILLESEAVETEEVLIVESDDTTEKVETEHMEDLPLEMLETVEENIAECGETVNIPDEICNISSPLKVNESKPLCVEEKREEELQPEISQEGTSNVTEDKINETVDIEATEEISKLTGDLEKAEDEASRSQPETPLESEAVVTEDVIVQSDDTSEQVQTEHVEESPSVVLLSDDTTDKVETEKMEVVETVEESIAECEEIFSSPADSCKLSSQVKVNESDIEEKCEEKLQFEISQERTSDDTEFKVDETENLDSIEEIPKLTRDLEKPEKAPSSQEDTLLESEAIVTEEVIVQSDDTSEQVQTEHVEESPSEVIETVEENMAECEETIDSQDNICKISTGTSKEVELEPRSEIIESATVDEESSKPYNSQLEQASDPILAELPTEEDKQDFEWIEEVVPESKAATTEIIQDDEIEDHRKVIEIVDEENEDDSRVMQSDNVPFFSPGDSDSEDTVPTLVLEPDEVNPSSDLEKEIDQPSLVIHSSNDPDITDKLPEIEDILNDQGTVDDVVENIDMQENLETILAVASLQNSERVEAPIEPQISDKERREMEALRMAVESITETPSTGFAQVEDLTELVESVAPQEINETDTVEGSDLKTNNKTVSEEKPVESLNSEVSVNKIKNDSENHLVQGINDTEATVQILPDTSEDKVDTNTAAQESTVVLPDSSQSISVSEEIKSEVFREKESKAKTSDRPKRHKKSSSDNKLEELSINVDVPEREKPYSPKVTIKPIKVPDEEVSTTSVSDCELGKGSLKMTITKQFDKMHSVLKICESDTSESIQEDEPIPKLIIKPKMQQVEQQHSPKMSTRSSKQMYSPTSSTQRSGSPRITIKPVVKPEKESTITPLKIKFKPDEGSKKHSPKLNIKPVTKPEEECRENIQSPRITIKPILKPEIEKESAPTTPRLNIKPIKKLDDDDLETDRERSSPKITFKPLVKPQEPDTQGTDADDSVKERIVLKINKGNLPTPTKESKKREHPPDDEKSEKLAKITVKFSKIGGHAHIVQQPDESNKRAYEEQSPVEKIKKLKVDNESPVLTRSKHKDSPMEQSAGDTSRNKQREVEVHIVETRSKHTHSGNEGFIEAKRAKLKEAPEASYTKQKEIMNESSRSKRNSENSDDIRIIENKLDSPIVISEDSISQDSGSCIIVEDLKDPLGNIPTFNISTPEAKLDSASSTPMIPTTPTPRKRGRPRKVPIVVREEFKEQEESPKPEPKQEEASQVHESGRPKRSCRGQSVRATLGIKPRKPRGPGRGRGSKRGMGSRVVSMKPEEEPKISKAKLKLIQDSLKIELLRSDDFADKDRKIFGLPPGVEEEIKPPAPVVALSESLSSETPSILVPESTLQGLSASPVQLSGISPKPPEIQEIPDSTGLPPATPSTSRVVSTEIVMVDEETRMSADTNSRAQTPAKQVVAPSDAVIEESQSSVQSTATTESGKAAASRPNKAPRLEVQEPEGAVISADQLTEYYWNGNGPFMLQEQVAQFLGIKSFKRKYPGIMRRMLEMQERDFIRESGLASEHMCDLGLTAVNSADILDIMYSDFQEKYEEYCKHQRDRQAKELINKQKALSLAASQDKNKADITEQAVQSAAQWNASFNKTRKEQRKACMDLQTLTVHYPKGKLKQINKSKVGNYPVALVPGQFTDYYKEFTPTEINNLPLNTMCYNEINIIPPEESDDSGSEGSDSDSDSSSSSSGSCSSSSGVEDCKLCKHTPKKGLSSK